MTSSRRRAAYIRWGLSFALALALHAGGAMALLARWHDDADAIASAPAITIDLAPVAVAPALTPTASPPDPVESRPQPAAEREQVTPAEAVERQPPPVPEEPRRTVDLAPEPSPQPAPAGARPPKPPEKPPENEAKRRRTQHARLAAAPSAAERHATRTAAPAPGAPAHDPAAVPNWKSLLVATLERHKRYPAEAQMRGDEGVVELGFSVDRSGGVHHARILRSSGSALLDRATLALVARAAPLPPPPAGLRGAQIAIVVPIRYNIR